MGGTTRSAEPGPITTPGITAEDPSVRSSALPVTHHPQHGSPQWFQSMTGTRRLQDVHLWVINRAGTMGRPRRPGGRFRCRYLKGTAARSEHNGQRGTVLATGDRPD